jgi:hypothetical protein
MPRSEAGKTKQTRKYINSTIFIGSLSPDSGYTDHPQ